jgi:hypothetical protein
MNGKESNLSMKKLIPITSHLPILFMIVSLRYIGIGKNDVVINPGNWILIQTSEMLHRYSRKANKKQADKRCIIALFRRILLQVEVNYFV